MPGLIFLPPSRQRHTASPLPARSASAGSCEGATGETHSTYIDQTRRRKWGRMCSLWFEERVWGGGGQRGGTSTAPPVSCLAMCSRAVMTREWLSTTSVSRGSRCSTSRNVRSCSDMAAPAPAYE